MTTEPKKGDPQARPEDKQLLLQPEAQQPAPATKQMRIDGLRERARAADDLAVESLAEQGNLLAQMDDEDQQAGRLFGGNKSSRLKRQS